METIRVVMLDTVEDSNQWPVEEDDRVFLRNRIDFLEKGEEYELDARQARKLIKRGHARAAEAA